MRRARPADAARCAPIFSPTSTRALSTRWPNNLQPPLRGYSVAILEHCHGAIARVSPAETAFALRTNPYHFEIIALWDEPTETEANIAWCDRFFAATSPFSSGEVYVNSLDAGEGHRIREAYGPNWERLRHIKQRYDPTNFFHCNQNITPAA
jgi:FAD/FMN-containing dehydrogenase